MTTFAELVTDVYTITKRPDLVDETTLALKKAIIKEHSALDYRSDLAVTAVALTQPSPQNYRYTVSLGTLGINCRKVNEIVELPSTVLQAADTFAGQYGVISFKERGHDNIFSGYGVEFNNYYYRLGNTINLVAQREVDNVALYYYKLPSLSNTATYSDWLADNFPYLLYTHAAIEIFRMIGKDTETKMYSQQLLDHRMDVAKSEISAIG